ncbi:hypothetical protein Aduo_001326 [Ancylostoma duodenale]
MRRGLASGGVILRIRKRLRDKLVDFTGPSTGAELADPFRCWCWGLRGVWALAFDLLSLQQLVAGWLLVECTCPRECCCLDIRLICMRPSKNTRHIKLAFSDNMRLRWESSADHIMLIIPPSTLEQRAGV